MFEEGRRRKDRNRLQGGEARSEPPDSSAPGAFEVVPSIFLFSPLHTVD
ncbi:hypothetical protein [Natronorubrum texcoconense]|nr:hypothetical protein [Natronorubrum texcoconense]